MNRLGGIALNVRHPFLIAAVALGLLLTLALTPASAAGTRATCGAVIPSVVNGKGEPVGAVDAKQPVLLIHGFNGDWASTWNDPSGAPGALAGPLERPDSGYFVGRFDYKSQNQDWVTDSAPNKPSIADRLAVAIHCMAEQSRKAGGSGKVILVGYSMGGLAAQAAISQTVEGRPVASDVGGLASIGTPWQGVDQGGAQFASRLNMAFCALILQQHKVLFTTIPDLRACALSGVPIAPVRSAAGQAMIPKADGSLSDQMKKLPKLPSGFPVFTIAGNLVRTSVVFGEKRTWYENDGVVGTGSATNPPFADPHTPQPHSKVIECGWAGQVPPKGWKSWKAVPKAEINVSFGFLTPGCGHVPQSYSPDVAKVIIPVLGHWSGTIVGTSIAGTYTLSANLTSCIGWELACGNKTLAIRVACTGDQCSVTDNVWEHPTIELIVDGTTWRASGPNSHAAQCNNAHRPGFIALEIIVVSWAVGQDGIRRPQRLQGTFTITSPAVGTECRAGKGVWSLSNS